MAIAGEARPIPSARPASCANSPAAVDALRVDLGLAEGKCGTTKKAGGGLCQMPIVPAKSAEVDEILKRLVDRTQTDAALSSDLEALARVVHCHWHNKLGFIAARVALWTDAFPEGDTHDLRPHVARKLREKFGAPSAHCAAMTSKGERCKKRTGGQKVQKFVAAIEQIMSPANYTHPAKLEALLRDVNESRYCHLNSHKGDLTAVQSAKESILDLYPSAIGLALSSFEQTEETRTRRLRPTIVRSDASTPEAFDDEDSLQVWRAQAASLQRSPSPEPGITCFVNVGFDITPLAIVERSTAERDLNTIRKALLAPLDAECEVKWGVVYCYAVEGNPELVKIGFTTRSVIVRHAEWEFECNRRVKSLYPPGNRADIDVAHAGRVEALCHAELMPHSVKVECSACIKQHQEWFEVNAESAIATICKWSRWMDNNPYVKGRNDVWKLKSEWRREIANMQGFLGDLASR